MRVRNRLALVAAGAFCLLAAVYATATRPSAVEARLRGLLADALRAPCTFEDAEFAFLDGLTVRELRVLDPEDPLRPPLVAVGRARLDFNLDLLGRGPHITVVHLQRPTVRVTADAAGRPSLLGIAAPPAPDAPKVALPVIRIVDGTVVLDGPPALVPGDEATLTSIRADVISDDGLLRIPDGYARSESLGQLGFSLDISEGGGTVTATVRAPKIDLVRFAERTRISAVTRAVSELQATGRVGADATIELVEGVVRRLDADLRLTDVGLTVTFPDQPGTAPPEPISLALESVHATLTNGRVVVEEARGRAFGAPIEITGRAELGRTLGIGADVPPSIDVALSVDGVRVGPSLAAHLPAYLRRIRTAYALEGVADIDVAVRGTLDAPDVDAHLDVRNVRASYDGYPHEDGRPQRGFPWYAEDVVGTVDVKGSHVDFAGRGRHGDATVVVKGFSAVVGPGESHTEVRVDVTDLAIDDDVYAAFGAGADEALGPWRPSGVAERVEVLVEQIPGIAGGETGTQVIVHLDGRASFEPDVLPVAMSEASGILRVLQPAEGEGRSSRVELEGISATGPGFVLTSADGSVVGSDEDLRVVFDVERLEDSFRDGVLASSDLPEGTKSAIRLLEPSGAASVDARVVSRSGVRDDVVTATLHGVSVVGWEGVPLTVNALEGVVRYEDDEISTEALTGECLGGTTVRVKGSLSELSAAEPRPVLDIAATDLPLDSRLRDALGTLADPVATVWEELSPAPDARSDVEAWIRPPGHPDGQFRFALDRVRGGISLLGLPLQVESARAAYDGNSVTGESLVARRGEGTLRVETFTFDTNSGDMQAELSARGLAFPSDLVPLITPETAATIAGTLAPSWLHLPALRLSWDGASRTLRASGDAAVRVTADGQDLDGIHVRTAIALEDVVAHLPIEDPATVDGHARLRGTSLDPGVRIEELDGPIAFRGRLGGEESTFELDLEECSARVLGNLLEKLSLRLELAGERLKLTEITADLYGGDLTGSFTHGGSRLAYRGTFAVSGADLALYATDHQTAETSGRLDGEVRIRNPDGAAAALEGAGRVEVSGAEVRLPWISASLQAVDDALLGVAAIEGAFHSGHIAFDIRGRRLLVNELYFEGPSVPLLLGATLELQEGRGAIDMVDGRIDMVIYPRLRLGVLGFDPTGIFDRIVGLAQFMVRRLRVEGTTRNPRTRWELISGDIDDELRPHPRPIGEVRPYGPEPW